METGGEGRGARVHSDFIIIVDHTQFHETGVASSLAQLPPPPDIAAAAVAFILLFSIS